MKKLICLLCMFLLVSCSTTKNIEPQETSTTEPQETVAITTLEPTEDASIDFDPYDVYLRHSPLETLDYYKQLDNSGRYYVIGEDPGEGLSIVSIYDFNNGTSEIRIYNIDESEITPYTIENSNFSLVEQRDYFSSTVNTYKDDITHIVDATCHLDFENETYSPESEECAAMYGYKENFKTSFIESAIISYTHGDTVKDAVALEQALQNDKELQNKYIDLIFNFFKE